MKRFHPAVRALCERVRRPTGVRLMMGAALAAPAALMGAGEHAYLASVAVPRISAASPALPTDAPRLLGTPSDGTTLGPAAPAPETETDPPIKRYAQEYRISEPLARKIHEAAVANGISPRTAFGLVRAESSFKTRAVSPVGAVGLTQIMPATARWLKPGTKRSDLMDPSFNLHMGFSYLRRLIDRYDGNERLALTAFNRGPGTVSKLLKRGRNPDNGYADKVLTGKSAKHVSLMNAKFGRRR